MYRKIEQALIKWKLDKRRKPLIICGSRQVGKTYSILKFARENYETCIEINFEKDEDIKAQFERTLKPSEILSYLEIKFIDKKFIKGNTLLFFDEIQACPRAITALKFFALECPYDIIASGSMLGVAIAASSSYPVGYVQTMDMYPMDFEEFLFAQGFKETFLHELRDHFLSGTLVPEGTHQILLEHLRNYIICGGMPEVVKEYRETSSFAAVRTLQKQIVDDYYQDMAKYASHDEKVKVHECFESIPLQLAKENKKFQYKLIRNGGSARHYEASLKWLEDSGIIYKATRLKTIDYPLEVCKEQHIFKIYMFDTGLLLSQLQEDTVLRILQDDYMIYKGAIFENLTAQFLVTSNKPLYYFEPSSRSEIDFVLPTKDGGVPIEIKSSTNTASKSLTAFIEKYDPPFALKFSTRNINTSNNKMKCYPIYMLMFIRDMDKLL